METESGHKEAELQKEAELPQLPLFSCKEAYLYRVPPARTVGHRAELWDVNNWMATVLVKVVQADDDAFVRLLDCSTGDLFAECPVPTDKPLVTAVEPVIDSSRYFVLRIVDRESQRHAFIGIGFRERSEASDFNAALHDFLQYIKRKRTAEAMRHAYEERAQQAAGGELPEAADQAAPAHFADYSLKQGETLKLNLSLAGSSGGGSSSSSQGKSGGFVSRAGQRSGGGMKMMPKAFSLVLDGRGGTVAALSPPSQPPAGGCIARGAAMSISPGTEPAEGAVRLLQVAATG